MKEIILHDYLNNNIYYKINFISKKYCIIFIKTYLTKLDIKYIIKNMFKKNINNKIKINLISKKNFLKKYIILFK
ncbi:ribosomal protein L23, putative (apicoplast) [Plasmodium ovale]|uniref:Large subunit ribosomal protein 23 n=1 Tax=Plasmodium ovale TaxID=36330 RepID=H7CDB5_PLAOA|nr:large subunit ribosomal protein 23 [Plasmodium ovale]SCQ17329.1 ribosomal protein L23, putative [Plasmodium ovale]